eukprot:1111580-Rhodomonas_salina.1
MSSESDGGMLTGFETLGIHALGLRECVSDSFRANDAKEWVDGASRVLGWERGGGEGGSRRAVVDGDDDVAEANFVGDIPPRYPILHQPETNTSQCCAILHQQQEPHMPTCCKHGKLLSHLPEATQEVN